MKLIIKFDWSNVIMMPATPEAFALCGAMVNAQRVRSEGKRWLPEADERQTIEFELVDDGLIGERPDPIATAAKEAESSNQRWYKEYSEHQKTKKDLKEAQDKLAKIAGAASTTAAPSEDLL